MYPLVCSRATEVHVAIVDAAQGRILTKGMGIAWQARDLYVASVGDWVSDVDIPARD